MIIGFIGRRGSGKTLGMTARLLKRKKAGMRITTNYGPAFEDEEINAEALSEMGQELKNTAMGLDEIHVLLDSRRSASKRNIMLSYFLTQTRKRGVVLFYTSQALHQVDVRLRDLTDYLIFASKVRDGVFLYEVWDVPAQRFVKRYVLRGAAYYNLYDTERTITDFMSSPTDKPKRAKPRSAHREGAQRVDIAALLKDPDNIGEIEDETPGV